MEGQDDLFGGTEGGTVEGLLDVIPNKGDTMNLGGYTVTNMGSFPVDPQDALPTPVARATDPGTSWAAAGSVRNQTQVHRFLISLLRQFGPMTDEEIAHRWKHQQVEWDLPLTSDSGLRTRRKELVDMGVAEATGEERRTKSNRKTKVWRLVDGG